MSYIDSQIIGDCVLYCGDMQEIIGQLKANLIVTDPPYFLTSGGQTGTMAGKLSVENYNNNGGLVECQIDWPDFMPLLFAALKDPGHAYIMANNRHVKDMLSQAETAGFRFHNLLVWDKCTATPNRWYMKNCEFTGFLYKGMAFYINDCGAKQLLYVPQEEYDAHPTVKPVMLMKHYIEQSSKPDDVVLDPFMGVASTGVAAIRSGRKFIGIEIERRWFDIACARIEKEYEGLAYAQPQLI